MKMTSSFWCAGAVLFLCSSSAVAFHAPGSPPNLGPNLVVNGDFEDQSEAGMAVWDPIAKGFHDPPNAPFFDGAGNPSWAGGGRGSFPGSPPKHFDYAVRQAVAVTPGAEYLLTFDLNRVVSLHNVSGITITGPTAEPGAPPSDAWELLSPPANWDPPLQSSGGIVRIIHPVADTWETYSLELKALKSEIRVGQNGVWASESLIDNVSLREIIPIPEPATMGLLGLGLLALPRRRARIAC